MGFKRLNIKIVMKIKCQYRYRQDDNDEQGDVFTYVIQLFFMSTITPPKVQLASDPDHNSSGNTYIG